MLNPEVAGGFGSKTKLDTSVHPPRVLRLHYEIDAWLGDDLIQRFPCYLVTQRLWKRLEKVRPTGAHVKAVEVTMSPEFMELNPAKALPEFLWLKVDGAPGRDDFGLTPDARLVVSDLVLEKMKAERLEQCNVSDFE